MAYNTEALIKADKPWHGMEKEVMNTYEFRGAYIYIVQAESEEQAIEQMDSELGECLFDWDIKETYHQEEE